MKSQGAEDERLEQDAQRTRNWKRWGPYLSERQWATVREDYSPQGTCWDYFPHDHARSRAYRWGEDGLMGITDRQCRLCFALALWNEKDPILKERLYGFGGPEGNHGEDVKEQYFYLDSTPTHSYMKGLYKYPQAEFPYSRLIEENQRRGKGDPEFELSDTGVFDDHRYFDVQVEYAKNTPDDNLIRITISNRGPASARLHLLPTLWFRNTWTSGQVHEGGTTRPSISADGEGRLRADHETMGRHHLAFTRAPDGSAPGVLFTGNETNNERLFDSPNASPHVKDVFHEFLVRGRTDAVCPNGPGTKAALHYKLTLPAGGSQVITLRLSAETENLQDPLGSKFQRIFDLRRTEADAFYEALSPSRSSEEEQRVVRQAYAGLLWSKQFYHFVVQDWLQGDPAAPPPPAARKDGRNREWSHLYNSDVLSMPDKWEYPWFAAWDLAFHMIPFAKIDGRFAKDQLSLLLREWYMHPNGQIPAYEFAFSDVNPPVHAWAAWRVYKIEATNGRRDRAFLERVFQKLLLNFTWWVNRKDADGKNLFSGGFLGLDNIGIFDRSKPLPTGGTLQQADGTAWMAFYCATMLSIALELARDGSKVNVAYEDMASKFFEHFVQIADAMNTLGGTGLWDEEDGFYYDQIRLNNTSIALKTRSMVGLLPLIAVEVLENDTIEKLPGFKKRLHWFMENRKDLARHISYAETGHKHRLLAIPSRRRLERVLKFLLDENEFLSPYGIRSLSRVHLKEPFLLEFGGEEHRVDYVPGESNTWLFGGNSNWRGPIWFPVNYLLVEALERYHHFYGDTLTVEYPTGSGHQLNLKQVSEAISARLAGIFLPDADGNRACHGGEARFADDPHWKDLLLFHEYFHGENGKGLGASHQTGWTALVIRHLDGLARGRHTPPTQT